MMHTGELLERLPSTSDANFDRETLNAIWHDALHSINVLWIDHPNGNNRIYSIFLVAHRNRIDLRNPHQFGPMARQDFLCFIVVGLLRGIFSLSCAARRGARGDLRPCGPANYEGSQSYASNREERPSHVLSF
jgi:hypothetical protein